MSALPTTTEFQARPHEPLWQGNITIPDGRWLHGRRVATEAQYALRIADLVNATGNEAWYVEGRGRGIDIRVTECCWIVSDATTFGGSGCVALTFDEETARLIARLLNRHGLQEALGLDEATDTQGET